MKTTKILLSAIALVIISTSSVLAQGMRLSVGFEWATPIGDYGDFFGTGYGGSVRVELPFASKLAFFGTAGYIAIGAKEDGGATEGLIPVHVGAKFYFKEQQNGLYVLAQLGIHNTTFDSGSSSESSTDFSYAPGVGYHLAKLDFGVNYQIISTEGGSSEYTSVRLAFVLGGNK